MAEFIESMSPGLRVFLGVLSMVLMFVVIVAGGIWASTGRSSDNSTADLKTK